MPGVHIQTIHSPALYSWAQLELAASVAAHLARGKFVLTEPPAGR